METRIVTRERIEYRITMEPNREFEEVEVTEPIRNEAKHKATCLKNRLKRKKSKKR